MEVCLLTTDEQAYIAVWKLMDVERLLGPHGQAWSGQELKPSGLVGDGEIVLDGALLSSAEDVGQDVCKFTLRGLAMKVAGLFSISTKLLVEQRNERRGQKLVGFFNG